jgi:hypothetical protein
MSNGVMVHNSGSGYYEGRSPYPQRLSQELEASRAHLLASHRLLRQRMAGTFIVRFLVDEKVRHAKHLELRLWVVLFRFGKSLRNLPSLFSALPF